jgi:hypothetical protein
MTCGIKGHTNPNTTHLYAGIAANMPIKSEADIKSYADCVAFMGDEREKQVASNVRIRRVQSHFGGNGPHRYDDSDKTCCYCGEPKHLNRPSYAVVLYDTKIIIYHPDGMFEADNGGFDTPTTSQRASQFGPEGFSFWHDNKNLVANHVGGKVYKTGRGVKISCEAI